MRYRLEQPAFNQLLRDADETVLNLPEHVVGLEGAVAELKMALDNTDCAGVVEACGADVLLPDARAAVVRCENVIGAGWGISEAVSTGDEQMADDARGNAK